MRTILVKYVTELATKPKEYHFWVGWNITSIIYFPAGNFCTLSDPRSLKAVRMGLLAVPIGLKPVE